MQHKHTHQWLARIALTVVLVSMAPVSFAATEDVRLELRPHCERGYADADSAATCTTFDVLDPQTLKTPTLQVGSPVDMDIVLVNPSQQAINRVRVWLNYDPTILTGSGLTVNEADFPTLTPGEADIVASEGTVKIDATANATSRPQGQVVVVARVQFNVTGQVTPGSPIGFYDVQPGGHTMVTIDENGQPVSVLEIAPPGALLVALGANETSSSSSSAAGSCSFDSECPSALCYEGSCKDAGFKIPENGACRRNDQCLNNSCQNGVCAATEENPLQQICTSDVECSLGFACEGGLCVASTSTGSVTESSTDDHTAFGLLQVRNVRVTTEGSTAYLGWNPLATSQLKAYNVYYGTTSGQYIQRKTIPSTEETITIRNLPTGATYFFAVRAVNSNDEESAFSQEVAVEIGNPATSTAPLVASMFTDGIGGNPVRNGGGVTVPGETGASSTLALFLLMSAAAGTFIAARRQSKLITSVTNG